MDGDGYQDYFKGYYTGIRQIGGETTHVFDVYYVGLLFEIANGKWHHVDAEEMNLPAILDCTPYVLGYLFKTAVHEAFHINGFCGEAELIKPMCIHVSIAVGTAAIVCAEAERVKACIENPQDCPPGTIDPGFTTPEDLQDYLAGLCATYKDLRDQWNREGRQKEAKECLCDKVPPYSPPNESCPPIPEVPGGCPQPGEEPAFGNDWPIPSCGACP